MHLVEAAGRQRETETHRLALVTLRRMRARGRINGDVYRLLRGRHLGWLGARRRERRERAA